MHTGAFRDLSRTFQLCNVGCFALTTADGKDSARPAHRLSSIASLPGPAIPMASRVVAVGISCDCHSMGYRALAIDSGPMGANCSDADGEAGGDLAAAAADHYAPEDLALSTASASCDDDVSRNPVTISTRAFDRIRRRVRVNSIPLPSSKAQIYQQKIRPGPLPNGPGLPDSCCRPDNLEAARGAQHLRQCITHQEMVFDNENSGLRRVHVPESLSGHSNVKAVLATIGDDGTGVTRTLSKRDGDLRFAQSRGSDPEGGLHGMQRSLRTSAHTWVWVRSQNGRPRRTHRLSPRRSPAQRS
jgi:hypothetical protein